MCIKQHHLISGILLLGLAVYAGDAKVIDASAKKLGDTWMISATVEHMDVDRAHYANNWRAVTEDGEVICERPLGHPHKTQPVKRNVKDVILPEGLTHLYIEAHDTVHGWSAEKFRLDLGVSPQLEPDSPAQSGLQIGDPAPRFHALNQDGHPWRLEDYSGKTIIVYFYPGAMTGGCTKQACSYRDYVKSGADSNIEIVGISGDTPQSLNYFQQAEQLNFTLLSDPDGAIARLFGVPVRTGEKSIKRTVKNREVELSRHTTASRWTFIIDQQGKVVYRDTEVKAADDRSTVIEFIQNMEKN